MMFDGAHFSKLLFYPCPEFSLAIWAGWSLLHNITFLGSAPSTGMDGVMVWSPQSLAHLSVIFTTGRFLARRYARLP